MEAAFPVSLVIKSALAREGLKRILTDNGFNVRQSAAHPEELDATTHHDEHIVIFEGALLPRDTAGSVRNILDDRPRTRMILLNDRYNFDLMSQAFQAGVHAYVLQDTKPETLLNIIQLVSLGEKVAPAELIDELQNISAASRESSSLKLLDLNKREKAILDCLTMGMPNKLISREMKVSEATVKLSIKSIFRKLNVKNRTQAAILARESADSFNHIENTDSKAA